MTKYQYQYCNESAPNWVDAGMQPSQEVVKLLDKHTTVTLNGETIWRKKPRDYNLIDDFKGIIVAPSTVDRKANLIYDLLEERGIV